MAAEATLHQAVGNVLKFVTARSDRFQKMCAAHAQQKVTSCLHALLAAGMLYLLQKMCAAHAQHQARIRQMRLPLQERLCHMSFNRH